MVIALTTAGWQLNEQALRWWGKQNGWYTLNKIADHIGVATSTLSRVCNGKAAPGQELLASIRVVLGEEAFADIFTARLCSVSADPASPASPPRRSARSSSGDSPNSPDDRELAS